MSSKRKMITVILGFFFISIFFSFGLSISKTDRHAMQNTGRENFAQKEARISSNSHISVSPDCIQSESEPNTTRGYRLRERSSRLSVLFHVLFLIVICFSLWVLMKRAFLAYLQSYLYPPAQFLCKLLIQQKKDGKKWLAVF